MGKGDIAFFEEYYFFFKKKVMYNCAFFRSNTLIFCQIQYPFWQGKNVLTIFLSLKAFFLDAICQMVPY